MKTQPQTKSQLAIRLATIWLVFLTVIAGFAAMVTAILVAWPLAAHIGSRLFG